MKKFLRGISFYILIIIIIYMFVLIIKNAEPVKEKLSYTQLVAEIESGRIKEIIVSDNNGTSIVSGKMVNTNVLAIVPSNGSWYRLYRWDRLNVKYEIKTARLVSVPSIVLIIFIVFSLFSHSNPKESGG